MKQKPLKQNLLRFFKRVVLFSVFGLIVFLLLNYLFPLPDKIDYSVIITDDRGKILNAYLTRNDKWRIETELSEISPLMRKTIIAKEDRYFYYHPGVNVLAVGRALIKNIFAGKRTSGASTITMQVARALRPRPRTFAAKCVESFRALQLEWKYSKNEILQLYLNLLPYGGNIEGVKTASLLYFQKNPDHLSLAEITALSIIPNKPSSLIIGRANEQIIVARNQWLKKFAAENVFTKKEIEDALAEPLTAYRTSMPHFIPHLAYQLKQHHAGNKIATNIKLNTQLTTEKLVADYIRNFRLNNIKNAAVVILDNHTHKVITYVGSAGFSDTVDGGQVNGAAAIRQPGSTLKPLLYALCVDEGLVTPKFVLNDVPINYEGYAPENYDQKFNGFVTMEHALEHSLNIPAVAALKQLGKDKFIHQLEALHFQQIKRDKKKLGLSIILGGCGASLEEITGLFSTFAHDGIYKKPIFTNSEKETAGIRIFSKESSYVISDILSKVNRPDFPINWQATEHLPKIAWKTGTSYGRRDAWSIGYNKNYTVGVWVGNFSGQGVAELSGANTATPLLFKIFNTIDYNNNGEWFAPPSNLALRKVCAETGLPPAPTCTEITSDYFLPLISSTTICQHLQEIKIAADESISYCSACAPANGYKKKLYRVLAAQVQAYFVTNGYQYEKIPPHNPECEHIFKGSGPAITFPLNGAEYYISKKNPEPLHLAATTSTDVSKLYWYINDRFYKTTSSGEKPFFMPGEGPVKISCTDDKGRNKNIWIRVSYVDL